MYKQRKNFSFLEYSAVKDKEKLVLDAKKSLLGENLNIDSLNAIYQNKEVDKTKSQKPTTNATTALNTDLKFNTLETPGTTEAELKKNYDGNLVLGISKPYRITFTNLPTQDNTLLNNVPENNYVMSEEVEALDDEVLAPLDDTDKKIKDEDEEAENSDDKEKDNKLDYDFLVILPQSEVLPKELIDAVAKAGQGIIKAPILQPMMEPPIPFGKNTIKSIEDDIEGYSLVGFQDAFAEKLLKDKNGSK